MDDGDSLTLFALILLANTLTMIITAVVAVRRRLASDRLIAAVAIAAFLAALHQVVAARFGVASVLLSALLVALITCRVVQHRRPRRARSR
jgi:hypothetical protein